MIRAMHRIIGWGTFFSVMLIGIFLWVNPVYAEEYLGEICWRLDDSATSGSYVIGKFAVSHIGDGHFSLGGTFTSFDHDIPVNVDVANGTAEIIDETVVMTLVNSYYVESEEYGFSIVNIRLKPSTLGGTYRTIDTAYNFDSKEFTQEFGDGSIKLLPKCE